ncbi:MAG: ABC transporter substrate-binding protein [bacterium]|nr:ABC transporter substrate-binding protein [bacterium]
MKNTPATFRLFAILLFLLLPFGYAAGEEPENISIIDDLGQEIRLDKPATRIISLYSAHTENLFALGLRDEIIGVGRTESYPPEALEKNRFDYRSDPEKVIAANPDLVLIRPFIQRSYPEFVQLLKMVDIPVAALYPDDFDMFDPYIRKLAILAGRRQEAEILLEDFFRQIETIRSRTATLSPKIRVYFESVENGYKTVTPDSLPARAIMWAGGINIAQEATAIRKGSSIALYGVELLLERGNEIDVYLVQQGVMHAEATLESVAKRPGFHVIRAVQDGRVYTINEKLISSPTFRYVEGIRLIARLFYPDLFATK